MSEDTDILMITYNRPEYTRLSLARLLDTCDDSMNVWLWHNGNHQETLDVCQSFLGHPRLHEFHHSAENKKLSEPTNWLWSKSLGKYLGKVDDDCLVPFGWAEALRSAHDLVPDLGVVACWHFQAEDFDASLSEPKIKNCGGHVKLLTNCWVGGSGYIMKRRCVDEHGLLQSNVNWTRYCLRLSAAGWRVGWYYPLLYQDHMDDPRSAHTLLKVDADIQKHLPLSAQRSGVSTIQEWQKQLLESARYVQVAPSDPKYYFGWRKAFRSVLKRLKIST